MGVTGAITAMGAVSSLASMYGSYQQGKAEQATAEMNAQIAESNVAVLEAQQRNIKEAQKITDRQYRTQADVLRGQATTTAARNGLKISGTTASSISQSIMQLQMDNSYEQFNYKMKSHSLEMEKHNAYREAIMQRYKGKMAYTNGMMKAGTTALEMGSNYFSKYWSNDKTDTVKNTVKSLWNNRGKKLRLSGGFATTNRQELDAGITYIL